MITRIRVEKFQSLDSLDIPLGPLTVIVGPSNSGKSAFVRAITSLGRNSVPATTGVRVGSKAYNVTADFSDGLGVSIERGASLSRYITRTQHGENVYEKSGQTVPGEVAATMRFAMAEDADLAFSTQHDGPFMMSATGSAVARVLGSLTAATLLHDAVKEANRRKLSHDRQAKTREEDAGALATRARGMSGVKGRVAALREARAALDAVAGASTRVDKLRALWQSYGSVNDALTVLENSQPFDTAKVEALVDAVDSKNAMVGRYRGLLQRLTAVDIDLDATAEALESATQEVLAAETALYDLWAELGVCPTCGKAV